MQKKYFDEIKDIMKIMGDEVTPQTKKRLEASLKNKDKEEILSCCVGLALDPNKIIEDRIFFCILLILFNSIQGLEYLGKYFTRLSDKQKWATKVKLYRLDEQLGANLLIKCAIKKLETYPEKKALIEYVIPDMFEDVPMYYEKRAMTNTKYLCTNYLREYKKFIQVFLKFDEPWKQWDTSETLSTLLIPEVRQKLFELTQSDINFDDKWIAAVDLVLMHEKIGLAILKTLAPSNIEEISRLGLVSEGLSRLLPLKHTSPIVKETIVYLEKLASLLKTTEK